MTTTYEVKALLPRGIAYRNHSWDYDTREEAESLAKNLIADGFCSVRVFEITTRELTS